MVLRRAGCARRARAHNGTHPQGHAGNDVGTGARALPIQSVQMGSCFVKRSGFKRGRAWPDRHEVTRKARIPKPLLPKNIGLSIISKGPIRDRSHLARVANHPCLVCGIQFAQAHHIRECYPRTLGVRIGDDKTAPLCVTHHAELHMHNTDDFWKRYGIDAKRWARNFYEQTIAGRNRYGQTPI